MAAKKKAQRKTATAGARKKSAGARKKSASPKKAAGKKKAATRRKSLTAGDDAADARLFDEKQVDDRQEDKQEDRQEDRQNDGQGADAQNDDDGDSSGVPTGRRTPPAALKSPSGEGGRAAARFQGFAEDGGDMPTDARSNGDGDARDDDERSNDGDGRPTAGGLRRGRRRRLPAQRNVAPPGAAPLASDIPPLPAEADAFEFHGAPAAPASVPAGRNEENPAQLLERVRTGRAHVSALGRLPEDVLRALASEVGVEIDPSDRSVDIAVRLATDSRPRPARREVGRRFAEPPAPPPPPETVEVEGMLELHPDAYGFLRRPDRGYSQHPEDVYVSAAHVRNLGLQPGHWIAGAAHRPRPGQAYLALVDVSEINHHPPETLLRQTPFKDLTVVYPDTRLPLETTPDDVEMRIMDLFCPLGRGQRGLIVAPPRSGKTVLMTKLADAVAQNSPDVDIVVLLVDERPEEVTNMRRSVRGEVIASTFDKPAANHVRVAELVMEKVKRMVEFGRNVVLLLDSITRLGRAYNNMAGSSGRILSGGLDANALTKPKRFFGSARNVEGGGSLTIVATALVDTGSRLDQVIFEEFKGTGNMECVLSRDLANARVWPAIDVPASGTRNEDLLLHPSEMEKIVLLRRAVTGHNPLDVMHAIVEKMKIYKTNAQFLLALGEGGL